MKLYALYCSPTGGTKHILDILCSEWDCEKIFLNLCEKDFSVSPVTFCKGLFNQIHRNFTFQGKKIRPGTCF